jgi:hypothetical protein
VAIGEDHAMVQQPRARVIASLRDPLDRLFSLCPRMRNIRRLGTCADEVEHGLEIRHKRNLALSDPATELYNFVENRRDDLRRLEKITDRRLARLNLLVSALPSTAG